MHIVYPTPRYLGVINLWFIFNSTADKMEQAPQMKELMEWVPSFANKWEKIFHQLMEKDAHMIANICKDYKAVEDCCQKMFELWCDLYHDRTWNDLIKALNAKSVRKNAVAQQITEHLGMFHHVEMSKCNF